MNMPTTEGQNAVYLFIKDYIETEGFSPNYREIMRGTGLSSTSSVAHQLESLRSRGLIDYTPRIARSIRMAS